MTKVFFALWDMTVAASLVILVVCALRLMLRRAPRIYSYLLWSVVLLRLLCPFTLESGLSLIPRDVAVPTEQQVERYESIPIGSVLPAAYEAVGDALNGGLEIIQVDVDRGDMSAPSEEGWIGLYHAEVWLMVLCRLWPVGVLALAGYQFLLLARLLRRLGRAQRETENIYRCEQVDTPFVLGLFRPRIYIPATLEGEGLDFVLRHEGCHIRRGDHIVKLLACVALCLHWFNPLVWLAFVLAGRDMEVSCDEAVLKELGQERRSDYAQTLLDLSAAGPGAPALLAFGEGDTRGRIRNVLAWRRSPRWVSALALVVCFAALAACATDVPDSGPQPPVLLPGVEDTPVENETPSLIEGTDPEIQEGNAPRSGTEALRAAVMEKHFRDSGEDLFRCASIMVLDSENIRFMLDSDPPQEPLQTVRFYTWVLYQEYDLSSGRIVDEGGGHIPTVITVKEEADGSWSLLNYTEPRDGSYHVEDIKKLFPPQLEADALDSQKFIYPQIQDCYAQAVEQAGLEVEQIIADLLDEICASPLTSSNPQDYIDEHFLAFRELRYYGAYAAEYCTAQLEEAEMAGAGGDLRSRVMEKVVDAWKEQWKKT